ncbi:MAG: DUF502 domain-containing protein [Planctomycetaceae bacterium]|nr:DUF502 domain-containing protein [Planctomycetaceae bacterium]
MGANLSRPTDRAPAARPFRGALLRGLAVLCPPLLTVLIIVWAINTTRSYFLEPVTGWAREGLVFYLSDIRTDLSPSSPSSKTAVDQGRVYHALSDGEFIPEHVYERVQSQPEGTLPTTGREYYERYVDLTYLRPFYAIPFFLAVFILFLYFLGKFMAAGLGGLVGNLFERMVLRLPGVRAIYSAVKQVTDFLFDKREIRVTRVVAVEYPRKGVWSMGFVTGEGVPAVHEAAGDPLLTVLIPYSPVPVTGCTIMVRRSDCIDLNITFDQACQFIVSCGVVVPVLTKENGEGGEETS